MHTKCRFKIPKPDIIYNCYFSQGILVDLIQHWIEFVHGKLQKTVNNTTTLGSVTPSTNSQE